MARKVSVAKAKAQLSECVRVAERGDSVYITRHGKAVAALVPASEVKTLERLRASSPHAGLAALAGGWKGSDEFVRLVKRYRRSAPRKAPALD
jgi:prevent-host-death family protein